MACDTFDILPHIPSLFMVSHEGETHKSQVNESQAIKSQTRELIMSANQKSKHVCNTSAFCFFYFEQVSSGVCLNPTPSADFWLPVFQHAAQLPQSTSPQTLAGLVWSLQSTSPQTLAGLVWSLQSTSPQTLTGLVWSLQSTSPLTLAGLVWSLQSTSPLTLAGLVWLSLIHI